jgi:flagellar biosynthetic protein FlhB
MASDEFGERTEQPTDRRRAEARQKGNVARSTDLTTAGAMLAAAAALSIFAVPIIRLFGELLHVYLAGPGWLTIDSGFTMQHFWGVAGRLAATVVPLMLFLMLAALFFNILQVGFLISPEALQPKFERLNPIGGAKRLFSIRSVVKLVVSLAKLVLVASIAAWTISGALPVFMNLMEAEPSQILLQIENSVVSLAFRLALALIVLAIIDFAFQRWKHEQDLRMTKQEVRDEMKNMEGDPLIRQRRREAHRKLAQARELQRVRDADVVITNPTQIAVALKYDPEIMPAPVLIAKGMGELAARIRSIAIEHSVPIIERKPLARALYHNVKVGEEIPVDMYEVFVEIMAYIYRITGRTPQGLT